MALNSWRRHGQGRVSCCLWIMALVLMPGCMNQQLRLTTRRTLNILPDLQYQQIVDNLAAIASNPGYLPYLAVAGHGSVQVTDIGNGTLGLNWSPSALTSTMLGLGASRNVTGTWSLGTITSPEKIRSMQAVYERAILGASVGDDDYCWLNIGCKREVPRDAYYVGCHDATCVWVMPEGLSKLSDMTLTIIDIATREDAVPGRPDGEDVPLPSMDSLVVPRRNFQVPATGPVYTPGVH
jgi:hypothetical protein